MNISKKIFDFANLKNYLKFVPPSSETSIDEVFKLADFLKCNSPSLVLTGAGCSTASGIPDYRSPGIGSYSKGHKPVTYYQFTRPDQSQCRRFWARNMLGFRMFQESKPNQTHICLASLLKKYPEHFSGLVTQNVDRLHHKAAHIIEPVGSSSMDTNSIVELHGNNFEVICLSCGQVTSRKLYQELLEAANPRFLKTFETKSFDKLDIRSDGDILLESKTFEDFNVPPCQNCQTGQIKPNLVFFGESVKREIVDSVYKLVKEKSKSLLVLGSSLEVFSSYRFVMAAYETGIPIAIVNIGPTRGDKMAKIKLSTELGSTMSLLIDRFTSIIT